MDWVPDGAIDGEAKDGLVGEAPRAVERPYQPVLRVLHMIPTLDPAAGGPSESVRLLLGSERPGYQGEAVTLDRPESKFLNFNFPVHALGPVIGKYHYTRRLRPWLRDNLHRFDFVVVNGLWQYVGLAALLEVYGRKPYFVFTHGMLDPYFKRRFPLKHAKKWMYWVPVEYWLLRGAARVLFTTAAEARLAEESFWLHRWKPLVVPYGSGVPPEDSPTLREDFLERVPEVRGKRFVLHLGRIHPKKGCDLLVQAFAAVAASDPELLLVMAGPDQQGWVAKLRHTAEKLGVGDRVLWPGMLTGRAKWGALRSAEVFALPSHQENFGIAVAEALGCRTPVLLSDKVNIAPEIAADGAGYMEDDTLAGTQRLLQRWIATSAEEREQMRWQAVTTFGDRYCMDRASDVILEEAGRILGSAGERDEGG